MYNLVNVGFWMEEIDGFVILLLIYEEVFVMKWLVVIVKENSL